MFKIKSYFKIGKSMNDKKFKILIMSKRRGRVIGGKVTFTHVNHVSMLDDEFPMFTV